MPRRDERFVNQQLTLHVWASVGPDVSSRQAALLGWRAGWRAEGACLAAYVAAGAVSSCPTQMFRHQVLWLPDGEEAWSMQTAVTVNQARASWDRGKVGQRPRRGWCWRCGRCLAPAVARALGRLG